MPATRASRGPSILVVEPEPSARRAIERALSKHGFTVAAAGSGQQAMDLAAKTKPDLAILNLGLRLLPAQSLVSAVRIVCGAHLPILAIGSEPCQSDSLAAIAPCALIETPYRLRELVREVTAGLAASPPTSRSPLPCRRE